MTGCSVYYGVNSRAPSPSMVLLLVVVRMEPATVEDIVDIIPADTIHTVSKVDLHFGTQVLDSLGLQPDAAPEVVPLDLELIMYLVPLNRWDKLGVGGIVVEGEERPPEIWPRVDPGIGPTLVEKVFYFLSDAFFGITVLGFESDSTYSLWRLLDVRHQLVSGSLVYTTTVTDKG